MAKEKSLRTMLSDMGVESVGVYTVNGETVMAIHCDSYTQKENAEAIIRTYNDGIKIL